MYVTGDKEKTKQRSHEAVDEKLAKCKDSLYVYTTILLFYVYSFYNIFIFWAT